jgi:MinD-like ATPase involved in chromosome partitioning or flagellar assembly
LADDDRDQTAAGEPHQLDPLTSGPGAEDDPRGDDGSAGEGPFGWKNSGLPSPYGLQPPFGTRASRSESAYRQLPGGPPGPGNGAGPGAADDAQDVYDAVAYDSAARYEPTGGYDTADAYGPPGGYDTAEYYDSPDDYGPAAASDPVDTQAAASPPVPSGPGPREDQGVGSTPESPAWGPPAWGPPAWEAPAEEPLAQEPLAHEPLAQEARAGEPPAQESLAQPPGDEPPVQEPPARPAGGTRTSETADSLTADVLLRGRHKAPSGGWRRAVYRSTGGLIRAPQSAAELRRRELTGRARTPVSGGHHRVAVLSLKGGVGKTTTTVALGATLASVRGDRIIAVDANPDRGTLSDKLRLETAATVRDLLNERDQIQRYADVRGFTTQAASRLEILASDRDPTVSVAFSEDDYYEVAQVLEHYYSICLADCGTGLLHSAMAGVLRLADQVVLVSSPSVDGARSASATLDWLQAHGYGDLVRQAVVVLSVIRPRSKSTVDLDRLEQHFAARSRAVVRIPYDPHLEEGAEVDLGQLNRATADAYLILAAEVGDGFARPRRAIRPAPAQY